MADVTSPFGFPYPEDTDLVRDGASDIENLAEGVNDYLTGGYLYAGTEYYTSSGTFAKADPLGTGDIGLRAIRVRMVGGGGGAAGNRGAFAADHADGSGGGACYAESFITDIAALDSSVTVTRGAGGTSGSGLAGNNGGTSSFGSLVTAEGGFGGARQGNANETQVLPSGAGGTVGTGDLVVSGSAGSLGALAQRTTGGTGGASALGGGGQGNFTTSPGTSVGQPGNLYGGGAGGSVALNDTTLTTGASGANGIVIIDCFV